MFLGECRKYHSYFTFCICHTSAKYTLFNTFVDDIYAIDNNEV